MTMSTRIIDQEAADWVARMDGEDWTALQEAELERWLRGESRRRGALLAAQAAWLSVEPQACDDAYLPSPRSGVSRRGLLAGGGGALAASLVGGLAWLSGGTSYQTATGEIRRVPLADGSIATINTASRLDVRLASQRREIMLKEGEAWFQVAKDAARPFVVQAGPINVEAVGTAFSVRRQADGADILVNEGVVEAWSDDAGHERVRLVAGQRAFVTDGAGIRVGPMDISSVDRALAWRGGMIDLSGDTLGQAVGEFNRYNRRQIVLSDECLSNETIDGIFRTDDPEGFATAIQASLAVPVQTQGAGDIVIGRAGDKIE